MSEALAYTRNEVVHWIRDQNNGPVIAERTPDELWYARRDLAERENHFYVTLVDFALDALGAGDGECLVIGSPVFEALELMDAGWAVTYLDVREPPAPVHWIRGDASAIPFYGHQFDAVSSTCVLCHVGLGRYGDRVNERADFLMMREIARVLRPGGRCALTVGPAAESGSTRRLGSMHRVYLPADVLAMAAAAGLRVLRTAALDGERGCWRAPGEACGAKVENYPDYLSLTLRKPKE